MSTLFKILKIIILIIIIVIIAAAVYALVNYDYSSIGNKISNSFSSALTNVTDWIAGIISSE